ncbi:uncharacterized protein LOC110095200 [Dendrobium catenatum]|uniref:uncharacterized protein LOC110095200 n=1 Tax=Dendrobium catenatum TaxID=906689 RepID=UPI00109F6D15|nr:uncharacterized protein LOC110095200 [Dendrobium catenatum]
MGKSLALVIILLSTVISGMSDGLFCMKLGDSKVLRADNGHGQKNCENCDNEKGIDITVLYTDVSGGVRTRTINSRDLSSSWVWENPDDGKHATEKAKVVIFARFH